MRAMAMIGNRAMRWADDRARVTGFQERPENSRINSKQ
jgi:hypothetical protein